MATWLFALYFLSGLLALRWICRLINRRAERQIERSFSASKGCEKPKSWNSKWPLGLDLLLKAFQYGKKQQIMQLFVDVVAESGNTFEQNLLFARGIDTVEPKNIEAILSTQFTEFGLGLRAPVFEPLMGSGIFTQDGQQWRHSRDLLRPQFATNRFANFEQIQKAVDNLIQDVPNGEVVDMQPLFFRLTFETTLFLLFGKHLPSLKSDGIVTRELQFAEAFSIGQDYLAERGRVGELYWLFSGKKFRNACKTCHDFVDAAIQKALDATLTTEEEEAEEKPGREKKPEPYVFVDALIAQNRDIRFLRSQCMNILLAGRDTTACCLTWTLRLLAQHPECLSRLRDEISAALGVGSEAQVPTISQLKSLPYLSLVVKEVLRLYPSVPVNSRTANKTTTLPIGGGPDGTAPLLVRKGEAVGYCVYVMHRRQDIYGPDADAFRPERWENDALKNIGWGYLPFNGGPRLCLGQEFALLETQFTIVRLLQTFKVVELAEESKKVPLGRERQILTLVLSSGDGCQVRMEKY